MRRASTLAALGVIVLSACAPSAKGPSAPIAMEQVGSLPALAAGAARQTVLEFVQAYASEPRDGGGALADLVAGPELENWVRWLIVQDAQFPGVVEGSVEVRTVAFAGAAPVKDAVGAQVDLGANVTFAFTPADGDPFERTRILDGPVTLVAPNGTDWRVIDVTRDGVPMSDGIQLFADEVRTDGDVSVRLDSLFMFTPNWQFNVVVENRTAGDLRLDPDATGLYVERSAGTFERVEGAISPALAILPSNRGVQSLLSYPAQDSARGRVLVLVFRQGSTGFRFDFPLQDLVRKVPPPAPPTASGAPQVG